MRLIDADELLRLSHRFHISEFDRDGVEIIYADTVRNAPTVETQKTGKWIPVTERLPEKDGKYLITEVDGYVTCDYFRLENGDWRTTFWRYPIAWMPLPEPYKENES